MTYPSGVPLKYESPNVPDMPKVALLFLVRGPMPLEPVWQLFLEQSVLPKVSALDLFSLYVHPSPGFYYPTRDSIMRSPSLFSGHEIDERIQVEWGQHSVVEAERLLLKTALADPLNEVFIFLSESCIPLYPHHIVYAQLMAESKSRIHACANPNDPENGKNTMDYRWQPNMLSIGNVTKEDWRKSSQWISLHRKHAEYIRDDEAVHEAFKQECFVEKNEEGDAYSRFCVSDEHYVPTLLAMLHVENETYCNGGLTHNFWDGPYYHPHTYTADEATEETLMNLREIGKGCNVNGLGQLAGEVIMYVAAKQGVSGKDRKYMIEQSISSKMAPYCPLFARKIDTTSESVHRWRKLLSAVLVAR